jgi:uncharacterized protein (TIGR04255 family)
MMIKSPDSTSREQHRVRDLPDFTAPPLSEVVLSIQFAALTNLKSAHVGLLWNRLRADYPNVTEQPPIQTTFETFGVPPKQIPVMQIETFLSPPLPRYWFEHVGLPDLFQLQQDRIVHNWRQQSDYSRAYPRYESVKTRFEKEIELFVNWLSDEKLGELQPNQCEVTYTNIISLPSGASLHNELESVTPIWAGKFSEDSPNKLENANIQMSFLFSHDDKPAGRVYVTFQPAFRQSDRSPVIKLELTARGRPRGESIADALAFLDIEREQVVRTFAAVTSTEMHKLWGRTDDQR